MSNQVSGAKIGVCGVVFDSMNQVTNLVLKKDFATGDTQLYYQDDCNGYINIAVLEDNTIDLVERNYYNAEKGKWEYTPDYQYLYAILMTGASLRSKAVVQLEDNQVMLIKEFEPMSGVIANKGNLVANKAFVLQADVSEFEPGDEDFENMITILMDVE